MDRKKMERSHEPTQQQTMRKNMKKYDQSTEKELREEKSLQAGQIQLLSQSAN
jgi:hypothetical protein